MLFIKGYVHYFKLYSRRVFMSHGTKCHFSDLTQERKLALYAEQLCELLGCSEGTAYLLLSKNRRILTLDSNSILRNASFCKSNLKLSDVLENPAVMALSPYLLGDRISTLKEIGCRPITAGSIIWFNRFMLQTPSILCKNGFLMHPNLFLQYLDDLKCPNNLKLELASKLVNFHENNFPLLEIKAAVNSTYLAWKLKCSQEVISKMLHKNSLLRTESLNNLDQVIDVLMNKFEIAVSKICATPKLMTLDFQNLQELSQKITSVCNISICNLAKRQPSILKRPANSLQETIDVIESHNVTGAQLLSCSKILNYSASTLSTRLDKLSTLQNYEVLKRDRKFLWLVYSFNNTMRTSNVLKGWKLSHANARLNTSPLRISRFTSAKNMCLYLAIVFGQTMPEIKSELKQHPNMFLSSEYNAQKVVEFLTSKGITREQLWNGLCIVLYNADVVSEYFTNLSNREDLQLSYSEWSSHPNLIQLLIYAIEKDQKLTGNGVYVRTTEEETEHFEDLEEILLNEEFSPESCESEDYKYNVCDLR